MKKSQFSANISLCLWSDYGHGNNGILTETYTRGVNSNDSFELIGMTLSDFEWQQNFQRQEHRAASATADFLVKLTAISCPAASRLNPLRAD